MRCRSIRSHKVGARLLAWARAALLEAPGPVPLFRDLLTLGTGRLVKERAAVVAKRLSPSTVARAYGLSPGALTVYRDLR